MSAIGDLVVNLRARTTKFEQGMKRARKSLAASTVASRSLVTALAPIAGPIAIVAGFNQLARAGLDFNRAMKSSTAIMGELTDVMRGDMRKAAFEVAKSTKFAASEAAEAYFFLASAGLSAEAALKAMPQVAQFAQAGNFDLALATDLLTDAQSALGKTVTDTTKNLANMTHVSDVLVKANTLANASVQQFSEALTNKAGAALKVLGKDIEEGVAVLAAFADQGIKGAEAGTAMGIVLRDLQTKAIKNTQRFKDMGIAVFDSGGEMRNIAAVIADLENALKGMSDQQKKATLLQLGFADKSVSFIQTILGSSDAIKKYEESLREAGGTTADIAGKSITDFDKSVNKLTGSFSELGTTLVSSDGELNNMIESFAALVTEVNSLVKAMRELSDIELPTFDIFGFGKRDENALPDHVLLKKPGIVGGEAAGPKNAAGDAAEKAKLLQKNAGGGGLAKGLTDAEKATIAAVEKTRELNNQILILQGRATETGLELQKMLENGADPKAIERLRTQMELLEDLKMLEEALAAKSLKQSEAQQAAADKLEQSQDARKDQLKALFDQTRTPFEKFRLEMERLKKLTGGKGDLFGRGAIAAAATFKASQDKGDSSGVGATGPRFGGALEGKAAFSAILNASRGGSKNKTEKNTKKTADNTKTSAELFAEAVALLKTGNVKVISSLGSTP